MHSETLDSYTTAHADGSQPLLLLRAGASRSGERTPVLLLHGSTLPGSIAYTLRFEGRSWLDDLAQRGFDAWALDVRGYGDSWRPEDSGERPCEPVADTAQALEDVARAIAFIREQTGASAVDLVGWSWGATVAAAYAASGGAVRRLALHAPQWLRDTPSPLVTPQTMNEPYRTVDAAAFVERWLGRVKPEARQTLESWRGTLEQALEQHAPVLVPNGSIRDIAGQWMADAPAYDPADIEVPTMVIVGAADTDTPPALGRQVFDRLGSDERVFTEVPDGTHFTVFEPAREDLFGMIAEFLNAGATSQGELS